MKRILITGNAGSGKTSLAQHLALQLNRPVHSLDSIVWQSGWVRRPREEKEKKISELTSQDSWIIDGVSFSVQEKADVVVFIDVPRYISFWRVFKRNWRYLFRSRPDLPLNCPEWRIIPMLCKIIWNFPKNVRPAILKRMNMKVNNQRCYHIRSNRDILNFLDKIKTISPKQDEKDEHYRDSGDGGTNIMAIPCS